MEQSKIHLQILPKSQVSPALIEECQRVFPDKNESFILSRVCLLELCQQFKEVSFKKLDLQQHQYLDHLPDLRFSLSHTKDFAAVIGIDKNKTRGIGVDVEQKQRTMKQGAEKYFSHSGDEHQLSLLEVWSIKEAAFKAFSNSKLPIKLLKEISLKPPFVFFGEARGKVYSQDHPEYFIHWVIIE